MAGLILLAAALAMLVWFVVRLSDLLVKRISLPKHLKTPARMTVILVLFLSTCSEKYILTSQMNNLCKKDGGTKVFEMVTLPASRFGKNGELLPIMPRKEAKDFSESMFGGAYFIKITNTAIKNGKTHGRLYSEGRLDRNVQQIIRTFDHKILGESVWYGRIGGEPTPFGVPSISYCPSPQGNLIRAIFMKGN